MWDGVLHQRAGQKLTVGVPAVSSKATLVKGDDGTWRMSQVTFDDTVTCS